MSTGSAIIGRARRSSRPLPPCRLAVHRSPETLRLTLEVDLARIVPADRPLEVAIAAVIQAPDGRLTYWALTHPGPRPDFHRRDGFLIAI